jgi:ABC-2 type transport system ATP-binding protein
MLLNIVPPDSGEVLIDGARVTAEFRDRVGYLPEERGLYAKMRVLDLLLFLAELKGVSRGQAQERAIAHLERFGLGARTKSKVEELSKGNQQKVQFISAVIHDPDLVVLDEPFSGLDPVNTNLLIDMMAELKARGKAIIFSTHVMDFAEKLCDRIAMIDGGELVMNGTLAEIKRDFVRKRVSVVGAGDLGFVASLPYVTSTQPLGQSLGVGLAEQDDAQRLLAELVRRGIVVRKFDAIDVSLHDIFVDRTTKNGEAQTLEEAAS